MQKNMETTRKHNDFCILILTNGRPDRVITYKSLQNAGNTYPVYIVIDNEDKTAEQYFANYGRDRVVVFDKKAIAKTTDQYDNFNNLRTTTHVRNALFDVASRLGFKYFLALDDDYTDFRYKFSSRNVYGDYIVHQNIDAVFDAVLDFYIDNPRILSICFAQGGDFIGGASGTMAKKIHIKRKAMNTWFCSTERRFKFVSRLNEDVNTFMTLGNRGLLFMTTNQFAINQLQTQHNAGGMTDAYLDSGTYVKSFYTVMCLPSCTKIGMMGTVTPRLHHKITWNNAVPKIVDEKYKKK
jgi:hypothetical protein